MEGVRPFGGLSLVFRAAGEAVPHANSLDHQHPVLDEDVSFSLGGQLAVAGVDPARLQRATEGSGQSTGCCRDNVVKGRGVLRVLAAGGAIVLAYLVMRPEDHGLGLRRQMRLPDRSALSDDPNPRCVGRLLFHSTTMPMASRLRRGPSRRLTLGERWRRPRPERVGPGWGSGRLARRFRLRRTRPLLRARSRPRKYPWQARRRSPAP